MNDAVPTTSFEDIAEANEIALKIYLWVTHRIPHACLRGEVHHDFKLMLLEQLKDAIRIFDFGTNELKFRG